VSAWVFKTIVILSHFFARCPDLGWLVEHGVLDEPAGQPRAVVSSGRSLSKGNVASAVGCRFRDWADAAGAELPEDLGELMA
jgi:hypothetical protein